MVTFSDAIFTTVDGVFGESWDELNLTDADVDFLMDGKEDFVGLSDPFRMTVVIGLFLVSNCIK